MAIFVANAIGIVIAFAVIFISYYKWSYQYWKKRNIPTLEPTIPFGNVENPLNRTVSFGEKVAQLYHEIKGNGWKHCGIYMLASPKYFLTDLNYIKNIMTKDFQHFVDRGSYVNEKDDPISAHLFAIGGTKWRNLRVKMTPTFTSGKMKIMFHTLTTSGKILEGIMDEKVAQKESVDIKELLSCFSTDIIGSCAFGLECNTFREPDSPFRENSKKIFEASKFRSISLMIATNFHSLGRAIGARFTPKEVSEFFTGVVEDAVSYREKNNIIRKDFLQLMIDLKNKENENGVEGDGNQLTIQEVVAQCFVFFIAGFETSSTTMTFALYELAINPEIQDKVRKEINTVLAKHNNEVTYDAINEMTYMQQVVDETLRKYPPVPLVTRECTKEYKVPDEDLIIEEGMKVFIPIQGIHYDEEYYPNPTKFDPERFNEKNKKTRHPYAHLPFGEGPRICIGMRFGLMQTKVGLTSVLKNFRCTVNNKTPLPLELSKKAFIPRPEETLWLDFEKV